MSTMMCSGIVGLALLDDCLGGLGPTGRAMVSGAADAVMGAYFWIRPGRKSNGLQKKEDLWYRAVDFERFKQDVLHEARSAGCDNPQAQYEHIKRKFQDEDTLKNTAMNLIRTKSVSEDSSVDEASSDDGCGGAAPISAAPGGCVPGATPTCAPGSAPRRKHRHKRNVSFDFDQAASVLAARKASQTAGVSDELRRIIASDVDALAT